ncbi:MAG: hypothetical protein AAGG48_28590 [Planctomycetota bacterium]
MSPHLPPPDLDITKLIPRVERRVFAKAIFDDLESRNERLPEIFISDLAGGMFFTYAFQFEDSYSWASTAHLAELGVAPEDVPKLALDNLKVLIPKVTVETNDKGGRISVAGSLASSSLLIFAFWEQLEAEMNGGVAVAAPTHRQVWYCDSSCNESIVHLQATANAEFSRASHSDRLTKDVLTYSKKTWLEL